MELTSRLVDGLTGAATLKQLREGVTHSFNVRFRHIRAGSLVLTLIGATTLSTARLLTTTGLIAIARLVGTTGLLARLSLSCLANLSLSFLSYLSRFGGLNLISCRLGRLDGRLFFLLFLVDDNTGCRLNLVRDEVVLLESLKCGVEPFDSVLMVGAGGFIVGF